MYKEHELTKVNLEYKDNLYCDMQKDLGEFWNETHQKYEQHEQEVS